MFEFAVDLKNKSVTRRGLLSVISSLFDPLGFVAPVVKARILLQRLCKQHCGWDEEHFKALVFLYAFGESVDCHLLSSFCDDSNLHISLFKYQLSTMCVSKESISKFLIGNRFHVKLRIFSPENSKQSLQVKSFKG